jgi:hypothetical protein
VIIKGTFQLRQAVRNVAVTITEVLRRADVVVLWAVKIEMGKEPNHRPLPKDILKSLVAQALRFTQSGQSEKSMALNCARLHTADSDMEWIRILASVLAGLNQTVYLALDLEMLRDGLLNDSHTTHVLSMFTSLINELYSRESSTKVKIIFFTYKSISNDFIRSYNVVTVCNETRKQLTARKPKMKSAFTRTIPYRRT